MRIGEIIGHRCWMVAWGEALFGPHSRIHWRTDEPMTGKISLDGHAGVYAFKDRATIDKVMLINSVLDPLAEEWWGPLHKDPVGLAIGTVKLWGTVWEHQIGWRAQYGRVASIDELLMGPDFSRRHTDSPVLMRLRNKYCRF